jgi:hypothetical protein
MHGFGARVNCLLPHEKRIETQSEQTKYIAGGTMQINKWTLGLAAVGLVSFASAVKADEATSTVMTALSSTTISGYVDVSASWNPGSGKGATGYAFEKRDGFDVNQVMLSIAKPLEEGDWSAGYQLDLTWGPDATAANGGTDVRQAYVALRAPVGNGLDFKLGRWDTIIGYESTDSYKNPNATRSWGYTLTPTQHEGLLATYQAADFLSLNAGVANTATVAGGLNNRSPRAESHKTYLGSVAITAPDGWGFLSGSVLTFGVIDGFAGAGDDFTDFYVGATLSTGVEGLKVGGDFNYFDDVGGGSGADAYTTALYVSFKATEKLGLHLRGEYANATSGLGAIASGAEKILSGTATIQYDLWENVISRLELRWDHAADGSNAFNGKSNDYLVAANLIYKF